MLIWLLLGSFCTAAFAQDLSTFGKKRASSPSSAKGRQKTSDEVYDRYFFNVGSHTEFINNVQIDASGGMRTFEFAPALGAGLRIPMEGLFTFFPELNWVLPRTTSDSRIIKNLFMLRGDFGHEPVDWFRVRVGTSLMWLNQHGRGGSAELNNGNTTSTFYYPEDNRSSINNTLDVGAELLMDQWAVRLQTYTYSAFKKDRRQFSYSLFLTYYMDR